MGLQTRILIEERLVIKVGICQKDMRGICKTIQISNALDFFQGLFFPFFKMGVLIG
jgi:hypothetical protein